MLSNILYTFDIEAPKDAEGNSLVVDIRMSDGVIS